MLYYVDKCYEEIIKEFVPQIPKNTMMDEDDITARICLSKNIQGCLNAASWGKNQLFYRSELEVFRLYTFDEKDILEENLIDTKILWKENFVPDAYLTDEVWVVNQNLKPSNISYFILGTDIGEDDQPILTYPEYLKYEETYEVPDSAYIAHLVQITDITFLNESDLFIGKILKNIYELDRYSIKNFIPIEVSYEYDEFYDKFIFDKSVYISLKHLKLELSA